MSEREKQDGLSWGARAPSRAVPSAPRGTSDVGLLSDHLGYPGVFREARKTACEAHALPETRRPASLRCAIVPQKFPGCDFKPRPLPGITAQF
jgi:hypothetical protein